MSNHSIVIPVEDLGAATAFCTIALNPNGANDKMAGPVVYWNVDDPAGNQVGFITQA